MVDFERRAIQPKIVIEMPSHSLCILSHANGFSLNRLFKWNMICNFDANLSISMVALLWVNERRLMSRCTNYLFPRNDLLAPYVRLMLNDSSDMLEFTTFHGRFTNIISVNRVSICMYVKLLIY